MQSVAAQSFPNTSAGVLSILEAQHLEIETLRSRVRQLEQELAPTSLEVPLEWKLTPLETKVFVHLTTRDVVSKESIMLAIYSGRVDEHPETKIVDVVLCKIRKKLHRFGVEIVTHRGHGFGLKERASFSRSTTE